MRQIRQPAERLPDDVVLRPLEAIRGTTRDVVDSVLERHGLEFQGYTTLGEGTSTEISRGNDKIGYVAQFPDGQWAVMVFHYQTPEPPEPPERSRAIRLN